MQAYKATRRGDRASANRFFRMRVGAQAFTVLAMVAGGMYYSKDREKSAELRKLKAQADAEEKRQKWIRELEVRDEEDKARRAAIEGKLLKKAVAEVETPEKKKSSGGVLAALGLWSKPKEVEGGEADIKKATAATDEEKQNASGGPVPPKKERRKENPRSSLGVIGETISKKPAAGSESPKKD